MHHIAPLDGHNGFTATFLPFSWPDIPRRKDVAGRHRQRSQIHGLTAAMLAFCRCRCCDDGWSLFLIVRNDGAGLDGVAWNRIVPDQRKGMRAGGKVISGKQFIFPSQETDRKADPLRLLSVY